MSALVSVRDLVFDYGDFRALDGVSFDLARGSVIALVGPNGAGKTTLLRCLATLERPLSGSLSVDGIDALEHPRAIHKKIGFQQDLSGFYGDLSVLRNLMHAAASHGLTGDAIRTAAVNAAAAVDLSGRLNQTAETLSRGLGQRLAVARAIVHRPPLLLMDEPASGLDPEARHDLSQLIRRLRGAGITLIVSSHILSELEDYSTHMLSLRNGRAGDLVALSGAGAPTRRWRANILGDSEPASRFIVELPSVSAITADSTGIEFDFNGDEAAQAELLRHLIVRDVLVTSFVPLGGHLEALYLEGRQR